MKKALVLGAGGWLGRTLVARLIAEKREVIAVDIKMGGMHDGHKNVEVIETDIRDTARFADRLKECDTVFNCAGIMHPMKTSEIYAVNRDMPVNVYKLCKENGVKTFVHISSIAAYGANVTGIDFIDEKQPLAPITTYGKSKAQAETTLKSLVDSGSTRLIMLEPGVFYGVNPSANLRELLEKLKRSAMPVFSANGFLRTYVDIEKVVDALLLAETKGISGESYCIGDKEPMSTLRFYRILTDELHTPLKVLRAPVLVSRCAELATSLAAKAGIHLRLPTIVGEFGRHTFSTMKKAEHELGFVALESSEPGLRAMVKSVYAK